MQQPAWGQEIKHLMVLETTGFRIHDMEMKRHPRLIPIGCLRCPLRVRQPNGGRVLKIAKAPIPTQRQEYGTKYRF